MRSFSNKHDLPQIVDKVMLEKKVIVADQSTDTDILYDTMKNMDAIAAPLIKNNDVFGSIIIFAPKYKISLHSEFQFADGLSKMFSIQYELSDAEEQRQLRQKAEYHALQSQINPHFLFNSINTITYFCREDPEKARELLITLATYLRHCLQDHDEFISIYDEMNNVNAYLQLVKARFEDRLELDIDVPENLDFKLPSLILEPIVENAVTHGAMKRKIGKVSIKVKKQEDSFIILVSDNGYGISQEIIDGLYSNTLDSSKVGLSNVHKRLCHIYGKDNGLDIKTSPEGTTIKIYIGNGGSI